MGMKILCTIVHLTLIIWWLFSIKGLYRHFQELPSGDNKDMVSVGILAEVILLAGNIIKIMIL